MSLPNKIIIIDNPDKSYHEHWFNNRNALNIPHPFRCIISGKPNCGKSTVVLNLIIRAQPEFQQIYVIHVDSGYTKEYNEIDAEYLDEIPDPKFWTGEHKTLVVLDDIELSNLDKIQKGNLDRLFGYVSTHKNISVILTSQNAFVIPTTIRRCTNLFILYKSPDLTHLAQLAGKTGMDKLKFMELFKQHITSYHDALWLDYTVNSPYPIRKNGYEVLERANDTNDTVIDDSI